jgi:hypothetical protein
VTDDELKRFLKPKTHWGAVVGTAIVVAGAVWSGTTWLHTRASADDTKALQSDVFKVRLDQETVKGDVKAINVRLDEGFRAVNQKLDAINEPKRRR